MDYTKLLRKNSSEYGFKLNVFSFISFSMN